jgi:RHS repeat-associated protein
MKTKLAFFPADGVRFATVCLAFLFCCVPGANADDPRATKIIGTGPYYSLAVKTDGTVMAWGYNGWGTLGDGTLTERLSPVFALGLTNIVSVGGGGVTLVSWPTEMHSVGLRADGGVMSWGNNDVGQLGNGTFTSSNAAVRVSNLTNIVALAAGGLHSLALKGDGTVMAWGYGIYGQLGNGAVTNSDVPVSVNNLTNIIAIAGGGLHSAALRADGTVLVWGDNNEYELGDGTQTNMELVPGSHTLLVSAVDPSGLFFGAATNTFASATNSGDTIQNSYDGNGNITQRVWVNTLNQTNRTQTLTWDAFDRLIGVVDRDAATNGFNWTAVYDALGRRLQTISTVVVSNTPVTTLNSSNAVNEVDSWYDPQAEFLEVGVAVNDLPTIKVYGPDANGIYGGLQGVGGLEDVYEFGHTSATSFVQDFFGNILASINEGSITWNPARFSSYGPVPGYQTSALSSDVELERAIGWRGKRVDETGLIWIGARMYDPVAGRFISHDSMFDPENAGGFSLAGGDPVNSFDPDGRFGVGAWESGKGLVSGTGHLLYNVGGTIGYGVTSAIDAGFGTDLASTYQDEWDGIKGVGRGVKTLGGQAIHGQFGQIGRELTGGEGRSGAYRAGNAAVSIASLFAGGELGEAGNVGRVTEVADVGSQAAIRARVLANLAESATARNASKIDQFFEAEGARTFYTVQNEANASRLLAGGAPWPTSATKAHLGEGLYTWGTRSQAESYLSALEGRGASGLRIMEANIPESQYQALRSLDLRGLSDEAAEAWLGRHSSLFGDGLPHSLDHVIRDTGNFGPEFFFSKEAFPLLQLK